MRFRVFGVKTSWAGWVWELVVKSGLAFGLFRVLGCLVGRMSVCGREGLAG